VSPRWGFKKEDDLSPMANAIGNDPSLLCSFFKMNHEHSRLQLPSPNEGGLKKDEAI
jgi:hypothetical protein